MYSAWFGAMWERLIKTVKNCLFKVIGRNRLDYFQLLTVLSDIQRSVNDRPLTYRCSDDSCLEVIAPSAFIRSFPGKTVFLNFEEDPFSISPPNRSDLIESLKYRESLLHKFKLLWYEQYLLSLRELSNDLYQIDFDKIKVDDVLIKSFVKPRPYWNLGRVVKLTRGFNGLIRSALFKKGDKFQEHSIKHLFPIELSISHSFQIKPKKHGSHLICETENEDIEFNNLKLAFSSQGNQVRIQGILGADIFQFMNDAKIIRCRNGLAWQMLNGIAPFGNFQHLFDHQITPV